MIISLAIIEISIQTGVVRIKLSYFYWSLPTPTIMPYNNATILYQKYLIRLIAMETFEYTSVRELEKNALIHTSKITKKQVHYHHAKVIICFIYHKTCTRDN